MQDQDRENIGEETNAEEGGQVADSGREFAEGAEAGEVFGIDPPIIVDGGGQPQK